MRSKLNLPGWYDIEKCLELLPKKTTKEQLVKHLIELRIIKELYDLQIERNTCNRYYRTEYFNFGDFDFTDAYLSEECLQLVIKNVYKEIEHDFILDTLDHLIELKEEGKATDEEIEKYKRENNLL
jgi:hypothetical protein